MLALLVVTSPPSAAETPTIKPANAKSETQSSAAQDYSQQPMVFEYVHESMRYENDGTGSREVQARLRVQTTAGLTSAGQLLFPYNAYNETMEVRSVRVLRKDGSVAVAGPEAVQDLSAPVTQGAPVYTDVRQKHVTVPGVSVGDTVEYDVVVQEKPLVAGQFWHIWIFPDNVVTLDAKCELNVPKDRALKMRNPEGIEPSISVEGDRRVYRWATSNFKTPAPVDIFKNFKFDVTALLEGVRPEPGHRLIFSTFQNWSEVASWYAELERERRVPTNEVREKAHEITRGLKSDEEKATALYYWVSENIRYVSLSFGMGHYQPHAAAEVLQNRYGDCKDKVTLLEAMLEAEGVHADPVLVGATAQIDPEVPTPIQFDHVITFTQISGKKHWLDSTIGVAPYGYLLPQLRGSEALVATRTAGSLQKLPTELPFFREYHLGISGEMDSQGTFNGEVELQTRGDLEVLIRLINNRVSPEQMAKTADEILARTNRFLYGTVQYRNFRIGNGADTTTPVKALFNVTGKLVFVDPKASRQQIMEAIDYAVVKQVQDLKLIPAIKTEANKRGAGEGSIEWKGPSVYSANVELTFSDMTDSGVPSPKTARVTRSFAELQSSDSWNGKVFHGHKELVLRVPSISASDEKELSAFTKEISDSFPAPAKAIKETKEVKDAKDAKDAKETKEVKIIAPGRYVPNSEAQEKFEKGEEEYKRKNWATAIEAFSAATKADPRYPDAWRELGRSRMYERQYAEAEADFRKYLELAPDDHLAYLNMAWVLYVEQKFDEDRDLMLKRIAAAPGDGDANFRLGVAYLALHQPALAVPVLKTSVAIFPQYLDAHIALGRAYLETHQDLLAQEILRKAVAIDSSDGTLNNVAYILSEHNVLLSQAEEWSRRSIDVVEKELNQVSLSQLPAGTWALVTKLSHYWDTLGWVKFQLGNPEDALKYILAASQLNDESTISFHLGKIYENQDRKAAAIDMYLAALKAIPASGTMTDDAKAARERLVELVGGEGAVDERLKQFRRNSAPPRTVEVANSKGEQGITQYTVLIDAKSKVTDFSSTVADDQLSDMHDAVRSAVMPQSFPDDTLKALPRIGTLSCVAPDQVCLWTLVPVYSASRLAPAN